MFGEHRYRCVQRIITCALLLFPSSLIAQTAQQPAVSATPGQEQSKQIALVNGCVAECTAFEKRCKSPKNTATALKRDQKAGRPFGGLGALGILLGKNDMCTTKAKECREGCAKTGKAVVTIGNKNSSVPHFDIPASKASR